MSLNRNALVLLPALLIAASMSAGCKRITDSTSARAAASAPAPAPGSGPPDGPQNRAVETETVTPQAIAGGILATGKILVPEDRMANIGPVHEGRLSHLYAGQGSVVRKGQKLADL